MDARVRILHRCDRRTAWKLGSTASDMAERKSLFDLLAGKDLLAARPVALRALAKVVFLAWQVGPGRQDDAVNFGATLRASFASGVSLAVNSAVIRDGETTTTRWSSGSPRASPPGGGSRSAPPPTTASRRTLRRSRCGSGSSCPSTGRVSAVVDSAQCQDARSRWPMPRRSARPRFGCVWRRSCGRAGPGAPARSPPASKRSS